MLNAKHRLLIVRLIGHTQSEHRRKIHVRRPSLLALGAVLAVVAVVAVPALPASAQGSYTLNAATCVQYGPDVYIGGTWSGSTCTTESQPTVQVGSTLTIPRGTTLTNVSGHFFENYGSVLNYGTIDTCLWEDVAGAGVTTNESSGRFVVPSTSAANCNGFTEHFVDASAQFLNYGAYQNASSLDIYGSFTNFCGSSYAESGTVYGGAPTFSGVSRCISSNPTDTVAAGSPFSFTVTTAGTPSPKVKHHGKLPKGVKFHEGIGTATLSGTPSRDEPQIRGRGLPHNDHGHLRQTQDEAGRDSGVHSHRHVAQTERRAPGECPTPVRSRRSVPTMARTAPGRSSCDASGNE